MPVVEGSSLALDFSLSLEDGTEIDSTYGRGPAHCTLGDGRLLPSFEKYMIGMALGETAEFSVPPEDAFGQPNPSNVQRFSRDMFAGQELSEGLVMNFADARKGELPGVIRSFDDSDVMVDFNHPLAGRTLLFKVTIHEIEGGA